MIHDAGSCCLVARAGLLELISFSVTNAESKSRFLNAEWVYISKLSASLT
jgi:hypothetical protein